MESDRSVILARIPALGLGAALLLVGGCATGESSVPAVQPHNGALDVAGLHWSVPASWERADDLPQGGSQPRAHAWAAYHRPPVAPDPRGAELTVYYDPLDAGGAVESTLRHWVSSMNAPDGGDAQRIALRSRWMAPDATFDFVVVDGIYERSLGGGPMTGGRTKAEPGYRLVGAVVEGPAGRAFLRLVGPEATARRMEAEMRAMFGAQGAIGPADENS